MSTPETVPEQKRSFVYRDIAHATIDEREQSINLYDFSLKKRGGIRGVDAASVLQSHNLPVPKAPNQCLISDSGELVLRLSAREYWLLDPSANPASVVDTVDHLDLSQQQCYPLFCQHSHAWFVMTGPHLAALFAKLCGVDLRAEAFPKGAIAQTSVARVNAIVISHTWQGEAAFSILSDSASASYFWGALQDAMQEFNA